MAGPKLVPVKGWPAQTVSGKTAKDWGQFCPRALKFRTTEKRKKMQAILKNGLIPRVKSFKLRSIIYLSQLRGLISIVKSCKNFEVRLSKYELKIETGIPGFKFDLIKYWKSDVY